MYMNDLETYVRIDSDEVIEYVKENKEFFLRELGGEDPRNTWLSLERKIQNIIDKYDSVRRERDYNNIKTPATDIYEDLVELKKNVTHWINN